MTRFVILFATALFLASRCSQMRRYKGVEGNGSRTKLIGHGASTSKPNSASSSLLKNDYSVQGKGALRIIY